MLDRIIGIGQRNEIDVTVAHVGHVRTDGDHRIDSDAAYLTSNLRNGDVLQRSLHVLQKQNGPVFEDEEAVLSKRERRYEVV